MAERDPLTPEQRRYRAPWWIRQARKRLGQVERLWWRVRHPGTEYPRGMWVPNRRVWTGCEVGEFDD